MTAKGMFGAVVIVAWCLVLGADHDETDVLVEFSLCEICLLCSR